jgi:hypothetical protein
LPLLTASHFPSGYFSSRTTMPHVQNDISHSVSVLANKDIRGWINAEQLTALMINIKYQRRCT